MQPQLSPRYRTKGNQCAGARRDGCEHLKIVYDVGVFVDDIKLDLLNIFICCCSPLVHTISESLAQTYYRQSPTTAGSVRVWSQLPPAPFSWPFQNSVESLWIVLLRTPNAIASTLRVASPVFHHFRWIYAYTS